MQIRRIEIRDFRKLSHVVVEDLQDGLNVLVGDNEAGKSTLLAALRAALFERHRVGGDVAAGMQPYGQSVRPEISIDFDLDGKAWRLRKAFCQRQEAELVGPGERVTGDAVEERLAEIFGFTPPNKGRSKPEEHQGIYGLLWVEQGGSYRSLGVGAGRDSIASALEREVGQVVGGERGRVLLAASEERRNSFWDKRGNPKGAYKALVDEVAALEVRQADLTASLTAHDEKVSLLSTKNEALARHVREDRLTKAVESVTRAREAIRQSERLDSAVKAAAERLVHCQSEKDTAAERKNARELVIGNVGQARAALATAESEAEEGRGLLTRHEASADIAEENLRLSRSRREQAENAVRALEQALAHRQATALLTKLKEELKAVNAADAKRRECVAVAEGITVRKEDIAGLEKLQAAQDRAQLQLDAASVQITFEPDGPRNIAIDLKPHDATRPLSLFRDAAVDLEGFGRLKVHPGGGVEALRLASETAARSLTDHLVKLDFIDLAAAREALAQRTTAIQEAAALAKTIAAVAPKGIDSLRQAVDTQQIVAARPLTEAASALMDASEAALDEAERALHTARENEQNADNSAAAARAAREQTGRQVATVVERAAAALRRHEACTQELTVARSHTTDDELQQYLSAAEAALNIANEGHREAKATLEAAEPEVAALELQRAENAERAIATDIETLTREKRDLEVELKTLGRDGIGEQLAEVEGQGLEAKKRLASRHIEAAAALLLHETLTQAQREMKDRWLGPLRERVKPYLKLIQPDSDIFLNENTLEIEHFVRKGVTEPFHSLSVGAREQVAVITRLALADILRASGLPSTVILDDALVNTDEGRLERMHLVLHKAAQALQVLVLTCRERDFLQLGAPIKRI